ncbi:MAG: LysR family transcriptional regulator [Synergistaceae bacterium]|nr:LysR family transcriptional regulator [Synergistaceae bacterium]
MGIREMNYIIAIAEEGSISKAAERLFMAQSSLSQYLAGLEHEVGSRLFVRTSTGVRPTESGRLIISYAYRELSEYHRLRDEIQDVEALKGGRVILGISTFRGTFLLPPVLEKFGREYPGVHVEIVEANSMALERMLKAGTIDIALVIMPPKILKPEDVRFLMRDEICIIAARTHSVLKFARPSPAHSKSRIPSYINLADTMEYEYLLSDYDTILGRESRRIFHEHDMIPKVHNEKLSAFMAASLGAAGLGLAFTYYCARTAYSDAVFLSLGEEGTIIELGICLAPGRYHSKASLALMETMINVLGD